MQPRAEHGRYLCAPLPFADGEHSTVKGERTAKRALQVLQSAKSTVTDKDDTSSFI